MTDVTDRTDGQTDTDRMFQKEVLNHYIHTEGRNISIDFVRPTCQLGQLPANKTFKVVCHLCGQLDS